MEKKLPAVSIIVPIYNVETYIARCLYSVMSQDYIGDLECVLVNDCTPDDSMSKVHALLSGYEGNVKFIECNHEHNRGLSAARNTGIDNSSGEYIFFLDSDDELSTNAISSLVSLTIKYGDVDVVYGDWYTSSRHDALQNGHKIQEFIDDRKRICSLLLSMKVSMTGVNKLIRHKYLLDNSLYFREGILHEDNLFTYYLAITAGKIAICHIPVYVYFDNPGSITNVTTPEHAISCIKIAKEIMDRNIHFMDKQKYRYCQYMISAAIAINNGDENIRKEIIGVATRISCECFRQHHYLLGFLYKVYFFIFMKKRGLRKLSSLCSKIIGFVTRYL